jgi:hypothetical protein
MSLWAATIERSEPPSLGSGCEPPFWPVRAQMLVNSWRDRSGTGRCQKV